MKGREKGRKEEKYLIGIDESSRSLAVGSLVVALVKVKPNFFRQFSWLGIKDSKLLTRIQINKIVDTTKKHLEFQISYIKPKDIDKENLNDLKMKAVIELLNTQYKFWGHEIFIDNREKDRDEFNERLKRLLPENLNFKKINVDKWTITHDADEKYKICSLASIYAKYHSMIEHNDIKAVWSDFGSGKSSDPKTIKFLEEHDDCVHIRKNGGENGN